MSESQQHSTVDRSGSLDIRKYVSNEEMAKVGDLSPTWTAVPRPTIRPNGSGALLNRYLMRRPSGEARPTNGTVHTSVSQNNGNDRLTSRRQHVTSSTIISNQHPHREGDRRRRSIQAGGHPAVPPTTQTNGALTQVTYQSRPRHSTSGTSVPKDHPVTKHTNVSRTNTSLSFPPSSSTALTLASHSSPASSSSSSSTSPSLPLSHRVDVVNSIDTIYGPLSPLSPHTLTDLNHPLVPMGEWSLHEWYRSIHQLKAKQEGNMTFPLTDKLYYYIRLY